MNDKTLIQLFRYACGTAILLASAFLHTDGALVAASLILLGVPIEVLKKDEKA